MVLPVRYVRSDKLLFHLIFCMLLHRDRGNSIAIRSWRIRSSRLLRTWLDSNMHFGKCDMLAMLLYIIDIPIFYHSFLLTGLTCLHEFDYQ